MFHTPRIWQNATSVEPPGFYPVPRFRNPHHTPLLPRLCPLRPHAGRIMLFRGGMVSVGEERWFYRSDEEWAAIVQRLKQTPCPHCQVVGALIRHGFLRGF